MLANPAPQFFLSAQPADAMEPQLATQRRVLRKRKPEAPPENNERLSKRLSLLNLEHSGTKLYVPVESQQSQSQSPSPSDAPHPSFHNGRPNGSVISGKPHHQGGASAANSDYSEWDSMMQLDDSKYKVYIRNLDEELSSESEAEEGGLLFLPDIEKHLRNNRIPPAVLARPDPDMLSKQLVLYRVPSSLSIPEEHDSVRKAIIEARARLHEKQQGRGDGRGDRSACQNEPVPGPEDVMTDDTAVAATSLAPPQGKDLDAMELD